MLSRRRILAGSGALIVSFALTVKIKLTIRKGR